jgi:hypothetical protein
MVEEEERRRILTSTSREVQDALHQAEADTRREASRRRTALLLLGLLAFSLYRLAFAPTPASDAQRERSPPRHLPLRSVANLSDSAARNDRLR